VRAVPPTIEDSAEERTHVVSETETVVLPCVASGTPAPSVTWTHNGSTRPLESAADNRYDIAPSGSLTIADVQASLLLLQPRVP